LSQRECFCFKFFHTKIRGPKFCHNGNAFVLNFSTQKLGGPKFCHRGEGREVFIFNFFNQKLGDLLGDLNFVTTRRLSLTTIIAPHHQSCQQPAHFIFISPWVSHGLLFLLEPDLCIICFRGAMQQACIALQGREPRKACFYFHSACMLCCSVH
jgi:hypothetical protein